MYVSSFKFIPGETYTIQDPTFNDLLPTTITVKCGDDLQASTEFWKS